MSKQRDLFDTQMELMDELIDRGLPTHVEPAIAKASEPSDNEERIQPPKAPKDQ
jgi:hypothetical protein